VVLCYISAMAAPAEALVIEPPSSSGAIEQRFEQALIRAERFFMGQSRVHEAAVALAERLANQNIPYAIAGAMALAAYGYERVTVDVDLLVTREGLDRFKQAYLGRGYVEKYPGSRGLRDTENAIMIDILIAGEYPGDGKPKPVAFPDPSTAVVHGDRFAILALNKLVEIKLASGLTAPHRLRDLADIIELIRAAKLPRDLVGELDPFVREKYLELWHVAQVIDPE
jgi:hypothetical protein